MNVDEIAREAKEKEEAERAARERAEAAAHQGGDGTMSVSEAKAAQVHVKAGEFIKDDEREAARQGENKDETAVDGKSGGTEAGGEVKKAVKKFALKLGKFGMVVADAERGVYEKFNLNRPLVTDQELADEYRETYDDTKVIIDNRVRFESEYGDIINLGLDVGSHLARRMARFYLGKRNRKRNPDEPEQEQQGGDEQPPQFSSVREEAEYYAALGEKNGKPLAPGRDGTESKM